MDLSATDPGKEHVASLEIAQLQYEIYLGVNESQLLQRPLLRRGQREILTSLFLREAWPPIECLYLVAAKNDEALARVVHRFPPCRETPKWRNSGASRRTDRLARSTRDLLEISDTIAQAGAGLESLSEPWADTTSPAGRMVLTVFAGLTEFEAGIDPLKRTGAGGVASTRTPTIPFCGDRQKTPTTRQIRARTPLKLYMINRWPRGMRRDVAQPAAAGLTGTR
jgi:Resolvase, N terminal domain